MLESILYISIICCCIKYLFTDATVSIDVK